MMQVGQVAYTSPYWFYTVSDKYYFEVDRMYGDLKDSFVYAQAV